MKDGIEADLVCPYTLPGILLRNLGSAYTCRWGRTRPTEKAVLGTPAVDLFAGNLFICGTRTYIKLRLRYICRRVRVEDLQQPAIITGLFVGAIYFNIYVFQCDVPLG